MRIAVIENKLKDYIINIFHQHSNLDLELTGFLDWKPKQDAYQDIPIGKIEDLYHGQYDVVLIAVKENRYLSRLLTYLHKKHIQNVYVVRLFALDMQEDFLSEAQSMKLDGTWIDRMPEGNEKPYLVHLETHVCDHCNLNCKACNNFSPFVKGPSYADIDQFERDLKRLAELFSGIGRFFLLGGEPLLAPELCCDMIWCFRKYFPNNELRVLTNATLLLSMKDGFWNCLRKNDVIIHISLYPPVKERIGEIRQRLEEEEIKYLVFREVETFAKHWTAYPFEDETYNNEHCGSAGCHYLRNGEISKCPDAILVEFMAEGHAELSGLRLHDQVELAEETDGWKLIERIDRPIDMCKKCTYQRLERKKWERVDEEAQPADWLLPHRYEAEIAKLKCANEKANREISKLQFDNQKANEEISKLSFDNQKANEEISKLSFDNQRTNGEIQKLKNSTSILSQKIEEQNEKIISNEKEIADYHLEEERLITEVNLWKRKFSDISNTLRCVQFEYERINNSYSHKVGRLVTWLPRKIRRILKAGRREVEKIKGSGLYKIYHLFSKETLKGYNNYAELSLNYSDRELFLQFYQGTGDVYLSSIFLKYCEINKIVEKSALLLTSQSAIKIASLLNIERCKCVLLNREDALSLVQLMRFIGLEEIRITNLHYMSPSPLYTNFNIYLSGLHGINFMDFYKEIVYQGINIPFYELTWKSDSLWLERMVKAYRLVQLKTVLIAPEAYSIGEKLPNHFWEEIINKLKAEGYTICTNIVNEKDEVLPGSIGVFVPYEYLQCFLEYCGYFIGYRSGLCELIAQIKCKKIIIYPNTTWPRSWGMYPAFEIYSLKKMGISDDVVELEYIKEYESAIVKEIVQQCNKCLIN